jgi:hypothetical protein
MKDILKFSSCILITFLLLIGCENEDFTGYSTLTPTNPTVTVIGSSSISVAEVDTSFFFDVALSEAQVVDVIIYVKQTAGDAVEGTDFKILNDGGILTISAGSTTGRAGVKILTDAEAEATETFDIQIGDNQTGNAVVTPFTASFSIGNASADDLVIDFTWTTDVADAIGIEMDPVDVVDLRLLVTDAEGNIVDGADGAAFEKFKGFPSLPDGTYTLATDIYSTIDAGDLNAPVTLSLALEFNQTGVINGTTLGYPKVMTNEFNCDFHRVNLATVVKAGANYTITKGVEVLWVGAVVDQLAGSWSGVDFGEPVQFDAVVDGDGLTLSVGLGLAWVTGFWGEDVIDSVDLSCDVDLTAGTITIPEQYCFTTTYEGEEQLPYNIAGEGIVNFCANTAVFEYTLIQDGTDWIAWCFENGYMDYDKIVAEVSLDAEAGKKIAAARAAGITNFNLNLKPVRNK